MRFCRGMPAALLLALAGLLCPAGGDAHAVERARGANSAGAPLLRERPRRDLFTDELRKRQTSENRVAICRDTLPAPQKIPAGRSGGGECARDPDAEPAFLRDADPRRDFLPPREALPPEPPFPSLPSTRAPPAR